MKRIVLIGSTAILTVMGSPALAQSAPQAEQASSVEDQGGEIVVTGYRKSQADAISTKRAEVGVVEAISAEDIGQLPDTTIAESLAKLPGITSARDRGNASQLSARGMGPRLTLATLNGREVVSSEPSRSVRFEQFPSELISGAKIYKTPQASLIEGGVAATIDLQTISPLDHGKRAVSVKAAALYYQLADDIPDVNSFGLRASGSYVDQFADGRVGIALGYSYQDQPSVLTSVQPFMWDPVANDLDGNGTTERQVQEVDTLVNRGKETRQSAMGKLEFQATDQLRLTVDSYYSVFDIVEPGNEQYNWWWSNEWGDLNGQGSNLTVVNGDVIGGTFAPANAGNSWQSTIQQANVEWNQKNSLWANGLHLDWDNDVWRVGTDLTYSRAKRTSVWYAAIATHSPDAGEVNTITFNLPTNRRPTLLYDNANIASAANYSLGDLRADRYARLVDEQWAGRLDISREMDGFFRGFDFGVRFTDRKKSYSEVTWNQPLTAAAVPAGLVSFYSVPGYNLPPFYYLGDFRSAVDVLYGGIDDPSEHAPTESNILAGWRVKETTYAGYAQARFSGDLGSIPFDGVVGARLVHTKQTGFGMEQIDGSTPTAVSDGISYTNFLPSLSLNFRPADNHILRLGVSRGISRAPLDEMRATRNLARAVVPGQPLTGSAGNPRLKPFSATQFDVSYEWYFGRESLISVAGFYKKVDSYIVFNTEDTTIGGQPATILHSYNGSGGNIRGVEFSVQTPFSFLPAPLDGFGINANYAFIGSNIKEGTPVGNPYDLTGLAKQVGSVTLWYNKGPLDARLIYTHSSDFTNQPRWEVSSLSRYQGDNLLDFALNYDITSNVQLTFEANNLTNEPTVETRDNINTRLYRYRESGRRFSLGANFKF